MIFEDFRSYHRICDVTGGKKGEKVPKWSKTPYILTEVCHRGVKLAWWVHVGMTNSLVALNLEIWEILILFVPLLIFPEVSLKIRSRFPSATFSSYGIFIDIQGYWNYSTLP